MPETLSSNILRRRAQRLRERSDEPQAGFPLESAVPRNFFLDIVSQTIDDFKLSFMDPVILFVNIHTMLIYGILYLWFELFPFGKQQRLPVISGVQNLTTYRSFWRDLSLQRHPTGAYVSPIPHTAL